jgi:hypothetical protein
MFPAVILIASLLSLAGPEPGEYRLMYEEVEIQTPKWDPECGPKPKFSKTPKNALLEVTATGDTWVARGAGRRFGPQECEGLSRHLKVTDHSMKKGVATVICFSDRVQAGTEALEHKIWLEPKMGRIHVETKSKHSQRVRRRYLCETTLKQTTVIASRAALKKRQRPVSLAATAKPDENAEINPFTGKPAVQKNKPPQKQTAMEKTLERELQEKMEQVAYAPVKIVHEHRMSKDFVVLSRKYTLDQKPLKATKLSPSSIREGDKIELFDDYLPEGVHTLEVEFKYRGFARNAPFRITLKDVFFFDIDETSKGQYIKVVGYERGSFFTARRDKPRVKFEVSQFDESNKP